MEKEIIELYDSILMQIGVLASGGAFYLLTCGRWILGIILVVIMFYFYFTAGNKIDAMKKKFHHIN